jgi:predicted esterase
MRYLTFYPLLGLLLACTDGDTQGTPTTAPDGVDPWNWGSSKPGAEGTPNGSPTVPTVPPGTTTTTTDAGTLDGSMTPPVGVPGPGPVVDAGQPPVTPPQPQPQPQPQPPDAPGKPPAKQCAQNKDGNGFFKLYSPKGEYVVRLPANYKSPSSTAYPLLVALHGCGDSALNFAAWGATTYKSRPNQNYIAISIGGRDGQCWNLDADPAMVLAAIDDVKQCFYVHEKKVTLAGYSSGGLLAYQLAFNNSSRFAGVLAEHTAIPDRGAAPKVPRKFYVAAIGGTRDQVFPPSGYRADWDALRNAGFQVQTQERDTTHDGSSDEWDDFFLPKFPYWTAQ